MPTGAFGHLAQRWGLFAGSVLPGGREPDQNAAQDVGVHTIGSPQHPSLRTTVDNRGEVCQPRVGDCREMMLKSIEDGQWSSSDNRWPTSAGSIRLPRDAQRSPRSSPPESIGSSDLVMHWEDVKGKENEEGEKRDRDEPAYTRSQDPIDHWINQSPCNRQGSK